MNLSFLICKMSVATASQCCCKDSVRFTHMFVKCQLLMAMKSWVNRQCVTFREVSKGEENMRFDKALRKEERSVQDPSMNRSVPPSPLDLNTSSLTDSRVRHWGIQQ
jgi:hypothetical protein